MVPEGWERKPIRDVCESIIDCVNKTAPVVDYQTPFKMIRTTNVRNGRVNTKNVRYVTEDVYKQWVRRGAPKKGDLILTREAPVGEVGILEEDNGIFLGQRTMMYRTNAELADNYFLFYSLQSRFCQKQIEDFSNGGTVEHMRVPDCGKIIVNIPSLSEQKQIAEILSTWDQAIETTEKLIENSKAQKKALMQQLLTGKKRLPGFSDEWAETVLNNIATVLVSPVDKKSVIGEPPVRLCNYTDVYYNSQITNGLDFMSATASASEVERFALQKNDVIITKDSETPGDIAVPALVSEELDGVVCGYHLAIIRPDVKVADGAYLNHLFSLPKVRHYFSTRANGVTRFGLTIDGIKEASFLLPGIEEQQNIAGFFDACDQELHFLNMLAQKLMAEKRALMQQLLTGKRRVKVAA